MAEEKINKKYGIPKILKKVIENELKNAEVMQSIAEVLERETAAIKC